MTVLPDSECHHMEICSHTEGRRKDDVLMSYLLIPAVSSLTLPPPLPFLWTTNAIAFQQHCKEPGPSATLESLQRAQSWHCASSYLFPREEGKKYQPGHQCSQTEPLRQGQHPSCHRTTRAVLPALSRPSHACCHCVTTAAILLGSMTGAWVCSPTSFSIYRLLQYLAPSKQYDI